MPPDVDESAGALMSKYKVDAKTAGDQTEQAAQPEAAEACETGDDIIATAATVGVVAIGAAIFEATLIPGIVLGAAAVLAPKYFPKLGERLTPLFHCTVRGAYKLGRKARTAVGECQEKFHDIAAEVHAEEAAQTNGPSGPASGPAA
jgi:hypothetical protein